MSNQAYPLQWPYGWPRTKPDRRQHGTFKTDLQAALRNLKREIGLMGGMNVVLSSNASLGDENPQDTGVVAYFDWCEDSSKRPQTFTKMAIPCDRWYKLAHNVQAIALTVEAMRGMDRWGAREMIKAMFTGFKQLPEPSDGVWFKVLGISEDARAKEIRDRYVELVKKHHPDVGGSHEEFVKIQRAFDYAREQGKLG